MIRNDPTQNDDSWLAVLPAAARVAWESGELCAFERELHLAELFSPGTAARLVSLMEPQWGPDNAALEIAKRTAAYSCPLGNAGEGTASRNGSAR